MPGFDRTGPWGEGPQTGGGFGFCQGAADPEARREITGAWRSWRPMRRLRGARWGIGGRGAGFGRGYWGQGKEEMVMKSDAEQNILMARIDELKTALEEIENRLNRMDRESPKAGE